MKWVLRFLVVLTVIVGTGVLVRNRLPGEAAESVDRATDSPAVDEQRSLLSVETGRLHRVHQISRPLEISGVLMAARRSSLAFERPGRLESVLVSEGQRVNQDEPLAVLNQRQLLIQIQEVQARLSQQQAVLDELVSGPRRETIEAARAEVESLVAETELRLRTLERLQGLSERNAAAPQAVDDARFSWKVAEAKKEAASRRLEELLAGTRQEQIAAQRAAQDVLSAQLERLKLDVIDSTLKAPFSGTIVRRLADEGRMLNPQQPVLELIEHDRLEAHFGIPAALSSAIPKVDYLVLSVGSSEVIGKLRDFLPQVDRVTRTQTAIVDIRSGDDQGLADGQLVKWRVAEPVPVRGFPVPLSALSAGSRGLWRLAVVSDECVQMRAVEVLMSDGDRAVIGGAVDEGDEFVVRGVHRLVHGQRVHVIPVSDNLNRSPGETTASEDSISAGDTL